MAEFQKVASTADLSGTGQKTTLIDGIPALLIQSEAGKFFAVEDNCTHASKPLAGGEVKGDEIECPFHGAKFNIKTGEALCLPASQPLVTFEVDVREDEIFARKIEEEKAPEEKKPEAKNTVKDLPVIEKSDATAASSQAETSSALSELTGEAKMLEALKDVVDPELMVNIVDLGLIYEITSDEGHVKVDMTLTSPACPVGPQLVQQAKMALERLREVDEAEINLVMSPPWSPERMTDDARDQLGIF